MESAVLPGRPEPLGAHRSPNGINFSIFARHADRVSLLLFGADPSSVDTIELDPAVHRTWDAWHAEVPNARLGDARYYAYRAFGSNEGPHRYDPDKSLLDPYARRVFFWPGHGPQTREAAARPGATVGIAPVGVLPPAAPAPFDWGADARPLHPAESRVIYELHVRGFTKRDPSVPEAHRGTYLGVVDKIPYLKALGVTTVELMPVHQFDPGENNYWGYMTLSFFAPHASYAATDDPVTEFKRMVRALHAAGIEVVLDVVYNHTTEEDQHGPTYSFRGLDNATYYVLSGGGRGYVNDSGTGNVFRAGHAQPRRLVLDSLRYWATEFRVDGFRYDLATILTRDANGATDPHSAVIPAIEHDPVLQPLLHIAEPWDLASHQVGTDFPGQTFAQWNDRFRDDVRCFVKSDPGRVGLMMRRLSGSPDVFPPGPPHARLASQSINFVVAHDGFCLNDLVTYNERHNQANGHDNRDGAAVNHNWNCGHEGEAGAPVEVVHLRRRQRKNLLTVLMLANGVPMLFMGDEFANTQGGNNNPYNQDNEITWLDWSRRFQFEDLLRFTSRLVAFRRRHPSLTQPRAWSDHVQWHGVGPEPDLSIDARMLAFAVDGRAAGDTDLYVMMNALWEPVTFEVQRQGRGGWLRVIDTFEPSPTDIHDEDRAPALREPTVTVRPRSIVVLCSAHGD